MLAPFPLAARLNEACQCVWVDRSKLEERLRHQVGPAGPRFPGGMVSGSVVFVDRSHVSSMDRTIALITRAIRSRAFEARLAATAPAIAHRPAAAEGGVLGFDFHLGQAEPQLVEINTNPGGLLVGLEMARAASACCECLVEPLQLMAAGDPPLDRLDTLVVEAFRSEFARARAHGELRTIAIVDDDPSGQYLYPEFLLYQRLLEQAGHRVLIADVSALSVRDGSLVHDGTALDLVYNRCTDFYLDDPRHAALRTAYEQDLAVVTPHPAAHARWSDKRILAALRDPRLLEAAGLDSREVDHLQGTIPPTEIVDPTDATDLWTRRKTLFFKPIDGFGGKATYRGDKLTHKSFQHVLAHRYVAQAIVPTNSRRVPLAEGDEAELRVDVRNFAVAGRTWLRAARLYRGQTTNFRTPGGGFAPVLALQN